MQNISQINQDQVISAKKAASQQSHFVSVCLTQNDKKCISTLQELINMTLFAYDQHLAMSLHLLLAALNSFIGFHRQAQKALKSARDFASELKDTKTKMKAY